MANIGKLGTALIVMIEEFIANGPSEDGDKEQALEDIFEKFLTELDVVYMERNDNQGPTEETY